MTDNKMTPEQFIEKWLPDYQERFNKLCDQIQAREGLEMRRTYIRKWRLEVFPEALEAFKRHAQKEAWDQGCEKQRAICSDVVLDCELVSIGYCEPQDTARKVENAPAPEFKLTEKE